MCVMGRGRDCRAVAAEPLGINTYFKVGRGFFVRIPIAFL